MAGKQAMSIILQSTGAWSLAPSHEESGLSEQSKLRAKILIQKNLNWNDKKFEKYQELFYPSYWLTFDVQTHLFHSNLLEKFYQNKNLLHLDLTEKKIVSLQC